jgi:hypothetical protein
MAGDTRPAMMLLGVPVAEVIRIAPPARPTRGNLNASGGWMSGFGAPALTATASSRARCVSLGTRHECVEHREIACAIIIDPHRRFPLQQRDDIPGILCPGMVGLFGGHREGGDLHARRPMSPYGVC